MDFSKLSDKELCKLDDRVTNAIINAPDNADISELVDDCDAISLELKRRNIL